MAERPEDLNLPNAVVTRIIKDAIPDGVAVSKEARLAISKAASVFVLYATSCSNNFALKSKRKTINAQDVLSAMEDMEFEQFIEPLQQCQEAFRQEKSEKKSQKKEKPAPVPEESGGEEEEEEKDEAAEKNNSSAAAMGDDQDFQITVNAEDGDASSPEVVEDSGE
ncbi:DNA polymerase epsilon subunit 3 [Aplysia californica]|uniref:DNA polymerase epsilon subunit 3 n=1 Tax=Aplysia californica TaxID=6500 RepID=A0ABM0K9W1_APLCA|nr:DNA polymerase epsilon subunit 3 [Aplysia californica]